MTPAFYGLGPTTGTYAERVALASPQIGQLFYQTDTDEYVKYVSYGGTNRWMQADLKPNRNVIINGGMSVAQRGTSFAMNLASPYYGLDRWMFVRSGFAAGSTYSQQVTGPTGFSNFLRVQRNSGNALTADNYIGSSFETVNVRGLQGKYLTVGFWARAGANYSSASGALALNVRSGTGTDSNYLITGFTGTASVVSNTVTLTSSWQFFSLTSAAVLSGSATQLAIDISNLPVGTAGTNDYFDITGVQLESGTAPSEFEVEPFETTLRKCQRYYEQYNYASGVNLPQSPISVDNANRPEFILYYTQKRTAPTISISGNTHLTCESFTSYTNAVSTSGIYTYVGTGPNSANIFVPVTTWTVWNNAFAYLNTAGSWLGISAEL